MLYTVKGFSDEFEVRNAQGQITGRGRYSFRPAYLEIPVLLLYRIDVGKTCKLVGGLGPYAAAGIGGKYTADIQNSSKEKIVFGNKDNRSDRVYNRIDYGVVASVGLDVKRLFFMVNYSYGLRPVTSIRSNPQATNANEFFNRSLGLTAGYWFGK